MSRKKENSSFVCENCGQFVLPLSNGSYRNHCPVCLHSKHVDLKPGDRSSSCKGIMKPISVKNTSKKGMQLVHHCTLCGAEKVNKVAEDQVQPDDVEQIIMLM